MDEGDLGRHPPPAQRRGSRWWLGSTDQTPCAHLCHPQQPSGIKAPLRCSCPPEQVPRAYLLWLLLPSGAPCRRGNGPRSPSGWGWWCVQHLPARMQKDPCRDWLEPRREPLGCGCLLGLRRWCTTECANSLAPTAVPWRFLSCCGQRADGQHSSRHHWALNSAFSYAPRTMGSFFAHEGQGDPVMDL